MLEDCRTMTRKDERAACCRVYEKAQAWVLSDVRRVKPVLVKGALGIFDCPLDAEDFTYL